MTLFPFNELKGKNEKLKSGKETSICLLN